MRIDSYAAVNHLVATGSGGVGRFDLSDLSDNFRIHLSFLSTTTYFREKHARNQQSSGIHNPVKLFLLCTLSSATTFRPLRVARLPFNHRCISCSTDLECSAFNAFETFHLPRISRYTPPELVCSHTGLQILQCLGCQISKPKVL
jgi:hypothetical protein